jgi:hypothetical protein
MGAVHSKLTKHFLKNPLTPELIYLYMPEKT